MQNTKQTELSKPPAVVLLSGGLDSCVTAAIAAQTNDLALLHLSYGQRTASREKQAFDEIADHFRTPAHYRLAIQTDHLTRIGGSALTDLKIPVPNAHLDNKEVPDTYVPFRNAHLLSLGVSWAESLGSQAVYIGVVEEDSSGYPDCTESFCEAFQKAAEKGTRPETHIEIFTPVIHNSKAETIIQGLDLTAPIHLTWSCYQNEDRACGNCDSCVLRLKAFKEAGRTDPIPYIRKETA